MKKAFFAGSFDPVTLGHMDVLGSALNVFDKIVVGAGLSVGKTPLFSFDERATLIKTSVAERFPERVDDIEIVAFSNLLIDAARAHGAQMIVRGLRDGADFDFEMNMVGMNKAMAKDVQTIFIPASGEVRHITATLVRQIAKMGGDVSPFVPNNVAKALTEKFRSAD